MAHEESNVTVALWFVVTGGLVFLIYWITNPVENGTSFRDWWRHRPTRHDPDRWERFKRESKRSDNS